MERFLKYYNYVKSLAIILCYGDKELANDLTQDLYLKLSKNTDKKEFQTENHVKAYLKFAIKNTFINHYRIKIKAEYVDINNGYFEDVIPEEKIETALSDGLMIALNNLPIHLKESFILSYLYEYKEEEIAGILKIPKGTVKNRNYRAKEFLREQLKALKQ